MLRLTDFYYFVRVSVCLGGAVSKQGQWCTVCESGGNNTHHSFRGSERGICKTAVLGQDCTGSAQKQEGQWSQSERMKEVTNDCRGWDGKKEWIRQPQVWKRSRCLVQDNGDIFFFGFFFFSNNKNCFCINLGDYSLKAALPWFKRHIVFHLLHTHIHTLMLGVKPINERLCKDNDDNLMQGSQPRLRNSTQLDSVPHLSDNDSVV